MNTRFIPNVFSFVPLQTTINLNDSFAWVCDYVHLLKTDRMSMVRFLSSNDHFDNGILSLSKSILLKKCT